MGYSRKRLKKVPIGRNTDSALDVRREYALSIANINKEALQGFSSSNDNASSFNDIASSFNDNVSSFTIIRSTSLRV